MQRTRGRMVIGRLPVSWQDTLQWTAFSYWGQFAHFRSNRRGHENLKLLYIDSGGWSSLGKLFFFSSESIIIIIARDHSNQIRSKFFQFIKDDIISYFYNLNPFEQENIVNTLTNTNFISLIQWNQWSCEHDTLYFSYWVISQVST